MRLRLAMIPLLLCATPAFAQAAPAEPKVPHELTDPATAERLVDAMQSLSGAFLNLPVGELEAAMQGREPTANDRRKTVRSETRLSERELRRQIEGAKPMLQQGMQQLAAALPAIMRSMDDVQRAVERAATNMPDPTYPKQ